LAFPKRSIGIDEKRQVSQGFYNVRRATANPQVSRQPAAIQVLPEKEKHRSYLSGAFCPDSRSGGYFCP